MVSVSCSESPFLGKGVKTYSFLSFLSSSGYLVLCWSRKSIQRFFFPLRMIDKDVFLVFCMQRSGLSSTICWRYSFLWCVLLISVRNYVSGCVWVISNPITLVNVSVFIPVQWYFYKCSSVIQPKIWDDLATRNSFIFQYCFC